ncbi:MAG: hypothetical protein AAF556_00220 [Pseudomonadota bacterium]
MALRAQTDKTTGETWFGDAFFGRPSDLSPECIDQYMRHARRLRASAFHGLMAGNTANDATDEMRGRLPGCADRAMA